MWTHVPHRVGRLLMPLPRRRMGLSSDEERALSEGAKAPLRQLTSCTRSYITRLANSSDFHMHWYDTHHYTNLARKFSNERS